MCKYNIIFIPNTLIYTQSKTTSTPVTFIWESPRGEMSQKFHDLLKTITSLSEKNIAYNVQHHEKNKWFPQNVAANLVVTSRNISDTWRFTHVKTDVSWCCRNISFLCDIEWVLFKRFCYVIWKTPIITHFKSQTTLSKIWESYHFIWRHKWSAAPYPILFTSSSNSNRRLCFACFLFQNIVYYIKGHPRNLREIQETDPTWPAMIESVMTSWWLTFLPSSKLLRISVCQPTFGLKTYTVM